MIPRIFNTEFDPVLLPGETATLVTANTTVGIKCLATGALPEYIKDFGALTAATWKSDQEDSNLELDELTLAQLRMRILDPFKLELNNLSPTKQWRNDKVNFYLQQFPSTEENDFMKSFLFKASEFFIWKDDTPRFSLYSDNAQTKSRIAFHGWRFRVEKLSRGVPGKITLYVSGWPSG